jgi:predicted RNase H-like HicB family nuclease
MTAKKLATEAPATSPSLQQALRTGRRLEIPARRPGESLRCWTNEGLERKVWQGDTEVMTLRTFKFVVERDPETGLLVGYVPGWPGAHTQAADVDELQRNLREVIEMLLEDGEPTLESEFVDVRTIQVA